MAFGTDYTPVGPMPTDIVLGDVDATSMRLARDIRDKGHGIDTRETMARMILKSSTMHNHLIKVNNALKVQNDEYYRQFTDVLKELSKDQDYHSLPEIAGARGGFNTLGERLEDTATQLARKVDKGNVSVSDINKNLGKLDQTYMSDELLQQMTGNTPINAVPADGSITAEKLAQNAVERGNIKDSAIGNSKIASRAITSDKIGIEQITSENILTGAVTNSKIADNSLTYNKAEFLSLVEPINLFDGYFTNFNLAGSSVFTFVKDPSTKHYGAILKINPGKTYSVATNPDYSGTIKVATSTQLVDGGQLNGSLALNRTVSDGFERVFTAGENDQYLYADLYEEGFLKVVESVNPVIPFIGEKYPIFPSDKKVSQIVWFGDSISCLRNLPHRVENAIGDKVFDVSIAGSTGSTHTGGLAYDGTSFVGLVDAVVNNDWVRVDESATLRNHWRNDENITTLKTVDFNTIDKVVLFYGTNDFGGTNNSLETYRSGMVSSIEKLLNSYPHLQFYFITPMYRNDWDTVNAQGLTLKEYVNETLEIAKRYGFPVLNAFESVGINDLNSGYYLNEDGLHQNDSGDELLGEKLSKFLLSN